MSPAALPYALLVLLVELSAGLQICLCALTFRRSATPGFLKMGAGMSAAATALTCALALAITPAGRLDSYELGTAYFTTARIVLLLALLLAVIAAGATWRGADAAATALTGASAAAAIVLLVVITAVVGRPTWSYAGTFLGLLAGALALGAVTLAMSLGHWYLVTPRLPQQPLVEFTSAVLVIMAIQIVLLVLGTAMSARPHAFPLAIPLAQNPAFWLRIGVGLVLAFVLVLMAWQASRDRGMMAATGLLYLATGAVLAGQALASALLFATAIPS